jgi:hypothetical protein
MTLLADDGEVQHGSILRRFPPAAGLGQGKWVPVELHHQFEELLEEGLSTSWLDVEHLLLGHHTGLPRLTARCGASPKLNHLVNEGAGSSNPKLVPGRCLR